MQPNLIDQLEVFLAVAETGSFSAAGKRLGRAVSAVSYAIANLEGQYQVTLFDRSGYRPTLTDDGRALLLDAEIIFRRLDRLNARISSMKRGEENEIRLAVDASFDMSRLADAMSLLTQEFPHVDIHVKTAHEKAVADELQAGRAHIALVLLIPGLQGKTVDGQDIALARHHLVAAPDHPLSRLNDAFPLSALDDHRQIIVAHYATDTRQFDYRVHTTDVLIVDSYDMQIDLISKGAGYGYALDHHVAAALAAGTLKELHCQAVQHHGTVRFGAIWPVKSPPGPAARRLLDILGEAEFAARRASALSY